jgi:hypothetical protein
MSQQSPKKNVVKLLPVESAPISVYLVHSSTHENETADRSDPLQRIGRQRPDCRSYLAELVTSAGAIVESAVLQLPQLVPSAALGEDEPPSNAVLLAHWQRLREDLEKLRFAQGCFPELLLPGKGESPVLPPTFFCEEPGALFPAPCPLCLAPLRSCRDDAVLASAGLPLFSSTNICLLYCNACHESSDSRYFYTYADHLPEKLRKRDDVIAGVNLKAQLAATIDQVRAGNPPPHQADLPCVSCPNAGPCFGVTGLLEEDQSQQSTAAAELPEPRWHALTLYDSPYLLIRQATETFEDYVRMIGSPGVPSADGKGGIGTDFLFTTGASGIDAVEVLTLKLTMFLQILQAVREHYRLLARPHLDICPAKIAASIDSMDSGISYLPRLWRSRAAFTATSGARVRTIAGEIEIIEPPSKTDPSYVSDSIKEHWLYVPRSCELNIDRLTDEPETEGRWRIEGRIIDHHGIYPVPAEGAWVQVSWVDDILGLGVHGAVTRPDPRVRTTPGELAVTSEPLALAADCVQRIDQVGEACVKDVQYKVIQPFGVKEDLYSLGMILLSILLVNDRNSLSMVTGGTATDKSNIFYQENDRYSSRPNAIPDSLWKQLIGIAFRITGRSESTGEQLEAVLQLDLLLAELEAIRQHLRVILFDRQSSHLEIQSVIAELLAEERT